jgi:hypothetical protein
MNSIKHFEHVWVEAEDIAEEYFEDSVNKSVSKIKAKLSSMRFLDFIQTPGGVNYKETLGEILFAMCHLSKKYNVNVWEALEDVIQDKKMAMLEDD